MSGQVKEIPVGVAPFDCRIIGDKLVVSNIGGRRAKADDQTAPSAGTETVVDERGIASTGSLTIISTTDNQVDGHIATGLHPTVIADLAGQAIVCNSNDDSLSIVNPQTRRLIRNEDVKPDAKLPFGSMPSCVYRIADKYLLVTLAGNNAVAVFSIGDDQALKLLGHIPTAWYPASLAHNETDLFIGSVKGIGGRANRRAAEKGRNSHDHEGAVQKVAIADLADAEKMKTWSQQVQKNSLLPQIMRNQMLTKPDSKVAPKPIPDQLGEPSLFKHVIYVIKENRTFDQVFGDYADARSDANF